MQHTMDERETRENGDDRIYVYGGAQARSFSGAFQDFVEGVRLYRFWHNLAYNDVKGRYRRSRLGELWLVMNLAIFVLSVGALYSGLLNRSLGDYLPYLTIGYVFWQLFASLTIEGCQVFIQGSNSLRHQKIPLTAIVLRHVDRTFITFAHNLTIIVFVLLCIKVPTSWQALLIFPALIAWWLNGMWASLVLGVLSARYRDVPPIAANALQMLFLISPVLWSEADVPARFQKISLVNPLSHFLAIARDPLLDADISIVSWSVVLMVTVAGWVVAAMVLRSYRTRVAYWA